MTCHSIDSIAYLFAGNWKDQFNPDRTRKGQFFINDKDSVEVDMMFQEEQFALGFNKELGVQVNFQNDLKL